MRRGNEQEIIIRPGGSAAGYWKDLWSYRELFLFLAWRDILVRYKQTVIGVAWCLLKPVLTMIVFTVIFGKLARLPSDGVPYPVLVFAALLPWQLFAGCLTECSNSLLANANLLSKVYFPRLVLPASSLVISLADFLFAFAVLLGLMAYYGVVPGVRILMLPFFLTLAFLFAFGAGLLLAALNVKYRDFRHIVPFLVQFGLFVSPVAFSSSVIPERWRFCYALNPMVAVIDGFRWCVAGGSPGLRFGEISLAWCVALLLFAGGLWYFRRTECSFSDVI